MHKIRSCSGFCLYIPCRVCFLQQYRYRFPLYFFMDTILVPTDFSATAQNAAVYSLQLAEALLHE